jgi:hypothetical protein
MAEVFTSPTIQGVGSSCYFDNKFKCNFDGFAINTLVSNIETTAFKDTDGARVFEPTLYTFNGSATGLLLVDDEPINPDAIGLNGTADGWKGSALLTAKSGKTYDFKFIATNISITKSHGGGAAMVFDWQGTYSLNQTWSA